MQNTLKTILEISIYSSAMILVVFGINKLFSNKISTKITHVLWLLVLVRLLLPVTFESPVNLNITNKLFPSYFSENSAIEETNMPATTEIFSGENNSVVLQPVSENAPADGAAQSSTIKFDFGTLALTIWLIVAVMILIVNLYRILVYSRKIRSTATGGGIYQANLSHAMKVLNLKKHVRIAESEYADIPLVYGFFKPVILLPPGFSKAIGDEKLSYIILHELCHVKRNDVLINYIWMLAKAVHWFNPLVYIAYKSYLDSIEECCDEMVVKYLDSESKSEYTQSLLDVIRLSRKVYNLPLSACFARNKTTIRKRVVKMMQPYKKSRMALLVTVLTACLMVFACFTTACHPKELADIAPVSTPAQTNDISNEEFVQMTEEDAMEIITRLNLSKGDSVRLIGKNYYRAEELAFFNCNNGSESATYIFFEQDKTLISYINRTLDNSIKMQLSEEELKVIAMDYAAMVWGSDNIRYISCQFGENETMFTEKHYYFYLEGKMRANGRPWQEFYVALNGKGELSGLNAGLTDVCLEYDISSEQAKNMVIEILQGQVYNLDTSKITLINEEHSTEYGLVYIFNYKYRADKPGAPDIEYDCKFKIQATTGFLIGIDVTTITENTESIPIEEANKEPDDTSELTTVLWWGF